MEEELYNNIDKIAMEYYSINPKIIKISKIVTEEIQPIIRDIENIVEFNQLKVLEAMKRSFLSDYHLSDSTGYGYNDTGRETIDEIYKTIFRAEDALVRPQIISGTHAITLCLLGVLRPGDELLSATGTPYDTLKDVIHGDNCGSLKDFNIKYREADLIDGKPNYKAIKENINNNTKMIFIQRSRGYSLRPSLVL